MSVSVHHGDECRVVCVCVCVRARARARVYVCARLCVCTCALVCAHVLLHVRLHGFMVHRVLSPVYHLTRFWRSTCFRPSGLCMHVRAELE